jgi:thymidylate synthase (FAD)
MLPAYSMYVIYRWSCSLQSIALFLNQRLEHDAQLEIRDYSKAVHELISPKFPVSINCLVNYNDN